jgi:hypothetical protein
MHADPQREQDTQSETLPLPVAQRCEEIDERDFAVLFQIAEDPEAPAGRLKRVPKKIPVTERVPTES